MKKFLLLTLSSLLLLTGHATAQTTYTGKVVNTEQQPVEFATVVLLTNEAQVCGTTTDTNGHFTLQATPGSYLLTVQHLNYETYSNTIEISDRKELGTIVLKNSTQAIEEVVVKAQLIRREADRFVVDVANSEVAVGKDGVELLERAPGVWITDDKIAINGRSGSKVYINDIELKMSGEELITYIKTLRAEEIQKIEIIPISGADYDADSASGIIKITLKRRRENGMQGSVQIHSTLNRYGEQVNPSANIALHSGRLDLNGAAWYTHQRAEAYAFEQTNYLTNDTQLDSKSENDNKRYDYGGRLDAVYEISKNHSIGLGGRFTDQDENDDILSHSLLRNPARTEETNSLFLNNSTQQDAKGTFNYVWKIDSLGSSLKLLAEYQVRKNSSGNNNHSVVNQIDSLYRDQTDSKYRMATSSLAWEQHFSPRIVLQAGAKYTYYRMQSDALYTYLHDEQWLTNEQESFSIDYDEQIAALYGIVRGNFNRWSFVAGLRGEYTRTESDGTKLGKDYFSLFPNLNLSYKLDPSSKHMLIGQYARKISRPSFWQLNPQRNQISDYSYQIGNPLLDPSYQHEVSLTYVGWYKYTLTAGFSLQTDEIQQNFLTDPNDPNIIYINHINYKDTRQYYLNLNAPMQLTKWWEANANLTYVAWEQRATTTSPLKLYHMLMTYASTTFTLPAKFYIDLSWNYHNRITMGNAVIEAAHQVNGSIKKRFGDRFTATFSVYNLLNAKQDIRARTEQFDRFYRINQFWSDRQFRIGLVWHFKSGKAFRERRVENSEEGNRL